MNRGIKNILLLTSGFAGGVFATLLLTPKSGKDSRRWISEQSKETKQWIGDKSHKFIEEGEKRIDRVSEGIKKTVGDSLPDLYKATEDLNFLGEEEKGEEKDE